MVQGGCSKFIPPIMAMMTLDRLQCPDITLIKSGMNIYTVLAADIMSYIFHLYQVLGKNILDMLFSCFSHFASASIATGTLKCDVRFQPMNMYVK